HPRTDPSDRGEGPAQAASPEPFGTAAFVPRRRVSITASSQHRRSPADAGLLHFTGSADFVEELLAHDLAAVHAIHADLAHVYPAAPLHRHVHRQRDAEPVLRDHRLAHAAAMHRLDHRAELAPLFVDHFQSLHATQRARRQTIGLDAHRIVRIQLALRVFVLALAAQLDQPFRDRLGVHAYSPVCGGTTSLPLGQAHAPLTSASPSSYATRALR